MNEHIVNRIYEVLGEYEWLADINCPPGATDIPANEIKAALNYLFEHSIDLERSTYALKHDAERIVGLYIRERYFLMAAVLIGYGLRRDGKAVYLERQAR